MDLIPRLIKIDSGDLNVTPKSSDRQQFERELGNCTRCKRRNDCFSPVLPDGPTSSPVYFQGRDPGKTEDEKRKPFYPTAPGGRHFHMYLRALGLSRSGVYVTNTVFCHGENDRTLDNDEREQCFRHKELELGTGSWRFYFLLGNDAHRQFLRGNRSVVHDMGKVFYLPGQAYFIPLLHPGHAMRKPELKRKVFVYLNNLRPFVRDLYKKEYLNESE